MVTKSGLVTINDHWCQVVTEIGWLPSSMWQSKHLVP
jgi:hypothetical protein